MTLKSRKNLTILAVETSCDDTGVAIIKAFGRKRPGFKILSNIVSSQVKIHKKYGGVYPFLAKREHQRNLPILFRKALREAGFLISKSQFLISKQIISPKTEIPKLDLIAVTVGPGLEPCLWTGVNFAKELANKMKLPVVPINHIEAHILANFIGKSFQFSITQFIRSSEEIFSKAEHFQNVFPAVCLVVSGGHTQLILMKGLGKYEIIGETRDDAAGECFDKTARILGLDYPGGPAIATQATRYKIQDTKYKIYLPRPMIHQKNYDFSFSGLKTAVLYKVKDKRLKAKDKRYIQAMCWEVQQAIIDVLIHKTLKAAKNFKAKSIILGGGVAANQELRRQFKEKIRKEIPDSLFLIPDSKFCTDNAAMIAATAYFRFLKKKYEVSGEIKAEANLEIK